MVDERPSNDVLGGIARSKTSLRVKSMGTLTHAGHPSNSLDDLLAAAFADYYSTLSKLDSGWFAKEHDCVNRFAMAHLVPACAPGCVLHDPAQIGIEVALKQPRRVGRKRAVNRDLVIWEHASGTCWNPRMRPVLAPLAVLEWKSKHPRQRKQNTDKDRAWLRRFTRDNQNSVGYSVFLEWAKTGVLRRLEVSRCSRGVWQDLWFIGT